MPDPGADREHWSRVEALVDDLLDLEDEARLGRLQKVEATDPALAARVGELLRAMQDGGSDLLESPAFEAFPELVAEAAEDGMRDRSGTILGSYRLLEVLGRGGMGVVYLAERADEEYEKRVAVKLLPRGLESGDAEARFRVERQVLARLDHPNIAGLLDGGVTDEGYPYLVMELVKGEPIDTYCERRKLGMQERLRLFLQVCAAVQFAHQNLVIHRDLKPTNVHVSDDGVVKLLDFGVAKMLEEAPGAEDLTRHQPGTSAWASPEQLANRPVSTASDVYSLGAVLYRLLTGVGPRALEDRSSPSDGSSSTSRPPALKRASRAALAASSAPVSWAGRLAGDLDNVVAKALAPEPGDRYATASALADDLRRYLEGQPVTAREATAGYRLRKFVGRHRVGFFASAAAVLALCVALIVAVWQADRARAEAERARRVASLMTGLFVDADPWAETSGDVSVVDLLDRGVGRVRDALAEHSEIRLELLTVLGRSYQGLGHVDRGIPILEEVLAERREQLGTEHPRTLESMLRLGEALLGAGRREEATPLIEEAAALAEAGHGPGAPETADYLFALGMLRKAEGDHVAQEASFRRLVALHRSSPTDEPSAALALALGELSVALDFQGRDAESLEIQREALEAAEVTYGPDHPHTSSLRNDMAVRLDEAGRYGEAAAYLRSAVESLERRSGVHETELVAPLSNLGAVLVALGDFGGALPYAERAAAIARRNNSPEDFTRIGAEINLATVERELGNLELAEGIYRDALARFESRLGPEHQATARARALLGATLARGGAVREAEEVLRAALAVQLAGERDPMSPDETRLALGRLLLDDGRLEEAEERLAAALSSREAILPPDHWSVAEVRLELALLARARGDTELPGREGLYEALAAVLPPDDFRMRRAAALGPRLTDATE